MLRPNRLELKGAERPSALSPEFQLRAKPWHVIREQQPGVVLIDSNLPEDEMSVLVRLIKDETPEIRCVVLTDTRRRELQAEMADADTVISRGRGVDEIIEEM